MKGTSISVILPAYREEGNIGRTLERLAAFFQKEDNYFNYEIIVVVDTREDSTADIAKRFVEKNPKIKIVVNERRMGKGFAIKRGAELAVGECMLFTDVDLSAPPAEIKKLLAQMRAGSDIAIGCRTYGAHSNARRDSLSATFSPVVRIITGLKFSDTQCGLKCFSKAAAHDVFKRQAITGFAFDVELLYIAKKLGYRVTEVPVAWKPSKQTRVNLLADPILMFLDLIRIRLRDFAGRYD